MEYLNTKSPKDPESSGQSRLVKQETDLQGPAGWSKLVQAGWRKKALWEAGGVGVWMGWGSRRAAAWGVKEV